MIEVATKVIESIEAKGYRAWIVGGAVRDMLSCRPCKDMDLVTSATPEELAEIFPQLQSVGKSFGVSLLRIDKFQFEVATLREERNYLDGRHPESVKYTLDPAIDVERRDFTINAMLYNPITKELLDYVGGEADLKAAVIRTVGDPERRFSEDYLRMLRAVRFAARFNFQIEPNTALAIKKQSAKCREIAPERVRTELNSMLCGPNPNRAIELLLELGILEQILPEVAILNTVEQQKEFHPEGNVFVHTMLMLSHMKHPNVNLAWSVLLHDIGKAPTFRVDESGRIRFFGHESVGADMTKKILTRLHFSSKATETISQVVRRHMHFSQVANMRAATLRKLLGSPTFALELELHRLDCISCHCKMDAYTRVLDEIVHQNGILELPAPFLNGHDLIELNIKPGRLFSTILKECYERQVAKELLSKAQAIDFVKKMVT